MPPADFNELTQAQQRIAALEAENKELLAIADNSALNLANGALSLAEQRVTEIGHEYDALKYCLGGLEDAALFAASVIKSNEAYELSERMAYEKLVAALTKRSGVTDPPLERLLGDLLAKIWPLVDQPTQEAVRNAVTDFMLSRLTLPAFSTIGQVEETYPHLYQFLKATAQEETDSE